MRLEVNPRSRDKNKPSIELYLLWGLKNRACINGLAQDGCSATYRTLDNIRYNWGHLTSGIECGQEQIKQNICGWNSEIRGMLRMTEGKARRNIAVLAEVRRHCDLCLEVF